MPVIPNTHLPFQDGPRWIWHIEIFTHTQWNPSLADKATSNGKATSQSLMEDEQQPDEATEDLIDEPEGPKLRPVKTCFVVCRDIPITIKAQLIIIRAERGWNSWADMVYDVVKHWGPSGEFEDESQ